MKVVDSQYVTMFMIEGQATISSAQAEGDAPVMRNAREALKEVYANGWQPYETIAMGIGNDSNTNRPQVQLILHLVKYENELADVKAKATIK